MTSEEIDWPRRDALYLAAAGALREFGATPSETIHVAAHLAAASAALAGVPLESLNELVAIVYRDALAKLP